MFNRGWPYRAARMKPAEPKKLKPQYPVLAIPITAETGFAGQAGRLYFYTIKAIHC